LSFLIAVKYFLSFLIAVKYFLNQSVSMFSAKCDY